MFYKFYISVAIFAFVFTACEKEGSNAKKKTNVEKCVEGVNSYWECLSSLAKTDLNNSSPKKKQCDNQLVQHTEAQSLSREKMSKVMDSLKDKIFASFSLTSEGAVSIKLDISEDCKKKQSDKEKKKCVLQENIKKACQEEMSEKI